MKTVQVTSGHICHDGNRYEIGDQFDVSDDQADSLSRLKVVKVIHTEKQEEHPVVEVPVFKETTAQPEGPVMSVDNTPFEQPHKKRGRRKRG